MELSTIEREIYIAAAPDVVYDVVSRPEHVQEWWPDRASYEPRAGATGEIAFGDCDAGGKVVALTVVEAEPPATFSFRWTHPAGESATADNSLFVTFALTAQGDGTLLRMTETGFRDEAERADHVTGWDHFLPRVAPYVATLAVRP